MAHKLEALHLEAISEAVCVTHTGIFQMLAFRVPFGLLLLTCLSLEGEDCCCWGHLPQAGRGSSPLSQGVLHRDGMGSVWLPWLCCFLEIPPGALTDQA